MLMRTHLAIGIGIALYFLPHIANKLIFFPIVVLTSLLPDVDSPNSAFGQRLIFKPFQWLFSHRGPIHSYTLCVLLSVLLAFFYPTLSLPFFLGYSFHLAIDSFTVNGIMPFWPLKFQIRGKIRTGGKIEQGIFFTMVIMDVFLFFILLF